jgi:hypothetical protein
MGGGVRSSTGGGRSRARASRLRRRSRPDRYVLYEAAVQSVEHDLDFCERVYRRHRGRSFHLLREDFCGTAALAGAWVIRDPANRAWGVDADRGPLVWAARQRLPRLGAAGRRLVLERRDVRSRTRPRVDVVTALNFSYWVFLRRPELIEYFAAARRSLRPDGMLVANAFGGTEAMDVGSERRRVGASTSVAGDRVPGFTYEWEQVAFNPIDHRLRCHIHFRLRDGSRLLRAFRYDWRLWTVPEIREAMAEAGFRASEVYVEGWDDERNRSTQQYRLRTRCENQASWLAFIVGVS